MKKKLLSCLMAGVLAVQGFGGGASAAGTGSIKVDSVSVKAGSQFELPVKIERNLGIAALSLELTYEADKLELLGAKDGKYYIVGTHITTSYFGISFLRTAGAQLLLSKTQSLLVT